MLILHPDLNRTIIETFKPSLEGQNFLMSNKSEVSLFNGCMYMLQVHQAVSLAGQHYSWFAQRQYNELYCLWLEAIPYTDDMSALTK